VLSLGFLVVCIIIREYGEIESNGVKLSLSILQEFLAQVFDYTLAYIEILETNLK
jgi:hypothetical protein